MNDLPIDQCVAVMDFSENVALEAQDEVEAAHWTTKQITLHLVYLVRHAEGSVEQKPHSNERDIDYPLWLLATQC